MISKIFFLDFGRDPDNTDAIKKFIHKYKI